MFEGERVSGMQVNRWWPDRACVLEVTESGGWLSTHRRRYAFRSREGGVPRGLRERTRPASRTVRGSAVPGPAERSAGWEVRAHDDLLYFLHSGRPRFVMSQAMAQSGFAAVASRLSAGQGMAETASISTSVAPSGVVTPAVESPPAAPEVLDLDARREARAHAAVAPRRIAPVLWGALAASLIVVAIGLVVAILAGPRMPGRAPGPRPSVTPLASVGARPEMQTARRAPVPQASPAPHPTAALPASAASHRVSARVPHAAALSRPATRRASLRFIVVSGSLPLAVAVRRVGALVASGLTQIPQVRSLSATRAAVYYGGFKSRVQAQALATRVRTIGYTAAVVTE